jgi:hypothetical protein
MHISPTRFAEVTLLYTFTRKRNQQTAEKLSILSAITNSVIPESAPGGCPESKKTLAHWIPDLDFVSSGMTFRSVPEFLSMLLQTLNTRELLSDFQNQIRIQQPLFAIVQYFVDKVVGPA